MAAYRRVYDSRHLQANCQEPGHLRNPMLGNRVWATFTCNCTCVYDVAFFWYIAFLDIPYLVPRVRCHRMRPISTGGVAWSVTCVDNHDREPCRNGWTDRDAAWSRVVSSGLKEPCIKCRCILASPGEYGCTIRAPKMWTVRWPRQLITQYGQCYMYEITKPESRNDEVTGHSPPDICPHANYHRGHLPPSQA